MSNTAAAVPCDTQRAAVEAALLVLEKMGLSPADLTAAPRERREIPTFAGYVPVVSAAVTTGTRRAYGSYWNRVVEHWGARRLDEPTPSEIRQLMKLVKAGVVVRRNGRGGRSAEEHLVATLRCLYRRATDDGLIAEADTDAYDRAARAPYGRIPPPSPAGNSLRDAARLLSAIAVATSAPALRPAVLVVRLAALAEAVAGLRESQQRAAQADGALRAARCLHAAGTAAASPAAGPVPGSAAGLAGAGFPLSPGPGRRAPQASPPPRRPAPPAPRPSRRPGR